MKKRFLAVLVVLSIIFTAVQPSLMAFADDMEEAELAANNYLDDELLGEGFFENDFIEDDFIEDEFIDDEFNDEELFEEEVFEEEFFEEELLNASPSDDDISAGENITWNIVNGMLAVTGEENGAIADFGAGEAPWHKYAYGIKSVYLEGITVIGAYAFYGLNNIDVIHNFDAVTDIKEGAFEGCASLEELTLPENLKTIGANAFRACEGLKSVFIPKNITLIGENAFEGIGSLSEITVDKGNKNYSAEDGVLFNEKKTELILYASGKEDEEYEIPESVEVIKPYAFKNAYNLKLVKLNDKLTRIEDGAFYDCSSIVNITIPENVSFIGRDVFHGCSSLEKFSVNRKNDFFSGPDGVLVTDDTKTLVCYPANRKGETYKVYSEARIIGENAFEGVTNLKVIEIHTYLEKIDDFAFGESSSIEKVKYTGSSNQWRTVNIGEFNEALTNAEIEFGATDRSYSLVLGQTYNLMDYLDDEHKEDLMNAKEVTIISSNPNLLIIDQENYTVTTAALGETLITATAKVEASYVKASVLISVVENPDAEGVSLGFYVGDESVDLKDKLTITGDKDFWDSFIWTSTNPEVAIVEGGIVTPVGPGEATILARLQDDKKAITCNVIVREEDVDYNNYFEFDQVTGTIVKYLGGREDRLVVPAEINGVPVLRIGSNAFANTGIQRITISKGIKFIDKHAFANARELSYVNLPSGLEGIGDEVFSGCSMLQKITIPGTVSVEKSGKTWFRDCYNLKGVTFEEGIESIGEWLNYSKVESVKIPETVTSINDYAFDGCSKLKTIKLPKAVTSIGSYAFNDCKALNNIDLKNITSIGTYAFSYSGIRTVAFNNAIKIVPYGAFKGCTELREVTLNDGVETIESHAFVGCNALKSVEFGTKVKIIKSYAFSGCGFETLTLPDSVSEIGDRAFGDNNKLKSVDLGGFVSGKSIGNGLFYNCTKLTEAVIGRGIASIAGSMFSGCPLKKITLSEGVIAIDAYAFKGCSYLEEVVLPDSLLTIGASAFRECTTLKKVTFGKNVTSIGSYAFYECTNIASLNLPDSVQGIGNYAFYGCTALKNINLPASLNKLYSYAFYGCSALERIDIPDSVESIGNQAFRNCTNLLKVTFGEGITVIGAYTFAGCTGIQEIVLPDSLESIGSAAFYECLKLKNIDFGEGVQFIGSNAFAYCALIEKLSFPDSLESINPGAFAYCGKLKNIDFGEGVKTIGSQAFYKCNYLETVVFPDSLESIGSSAFSNCVRLKNVTFGDGLKTISSQAFYNCYTIETLVFPAELETISSNAFRSCSGLYEVTFPDSNIKIGDYGFAYCTELLKVNNLHSDIYVGNNAFLECKFMDLQVINKNATNFSIINSSVAGYIALELNYSFPEYALVSNIVANVTYNSGTPSQVSVDGKRVYSYTYTDNKVSIPVTNKNGRITFMIKPGYMADDNFIANASVSYKMMGSMQTYTVGSVQYKIEAVSVKCNSYTDTASLYVSGKSFFETVDLYVDNVYVKTAYTNKSSNNYSTYIDIPSPVNYKTYTIKAVAENGKAATATTVYKIEAPKVTSFIMDYWSDYYGDYKTYNLMNYGHTGYYSGKIYWGNYWYTSDTGYRYQYKFRIKLENGQNVSKLYVRGRDKSSSTSYLLEANWNGSEYVTTGHFGNNRNFRPYYVDVISYDNVYSEYNNVNYSEKSPSDILSFFDYTSGNLGHSVSQNTSSNFNGTAYLYGSLKSLVGAGSIQARITHYNNVDIYSWNNSLKSKPYYYQVNDNGKDYRIAIQKSSSWYDIWLLNYTDEKVSYHMIDFFNRTSSSYVYKNIENIASRYMNALGIDILPQANNSTQNTIINNFKNKREAFLMASFALNAPLYGNIVPDRTVCRILFKAMSDDLNSLNGTSASSTTSRILYSRYIDWKIDPSGYVYEGVTNNRLEGVTATLYFKDQDTGEAVIWEDASGEEQNPQVTDETGRYSWMVSDGQWQIKFEKEGYKTYTTEWMDVPPPQTKINVELEPMVEQIEAPEVKITTDELIITYKDYMDPQDVINKLSIDGMSKDDYTIKYNEGSTDLPAGFNFMDVVLRTDPDSLEVLAEENKEYAKVFTVVFDDKLEAGDSKNITIGNVTSHIDGVTSAPYQATLQTELPEIKEVSLMSMDYSSEEANVCYVDYRNNTGKVLDLCQVMVAVYGENGNLISLTPHIIQNFAAYQNVNDLKITLPDDYKEVKFFVWDASNKPLGRVETFNK